MWGWLVGMGEEGERRRCVVMEDGGCLLFMRDINGFILLKVG